jgi:phosphoribosylformimino-5-aminoimidazole carboxamide ribotide isomerase
MTCEVVPVIDLLAGRIVHARRGERHTYAPVVSRLCASADPDTVVAALVAACDPRVLYVADLDALQGGPAQWEQLRAMAGAHPTRTFWIDAGVRDAADLARFAPFANVVPVLASESLQDLVLLDAAPNAVLSLDFRGEVLIDPAGVAQHADRWPERVIAMTLARVGSAAGPDFGRIADVRARGQACGRRLAVYAAGGVRGEHDLEALARAGVAGVLVASALHDGRLTAAAVARHRR